MQDMVKRKHKMYDSKKQRLSGRDPHADDPNLAQFTAHTWDELENSTSDTLLLVGSDILSEFIKQYDPNFQSSQIVCIGGIGRLVLHMRYPERTLSEAKSRHLLSSVVLESYRQSALRTSGLSYSESWSSRPKW